MTSIPSADEKRAAYIEGLRQIADFLDAHPEVPLPYLNSFQTGTYEPCLDIYLVGDLNQKTTLAAIARAMGRAEKVADNKDFRIFRRFAGIALVAQATREQVCERVVTGTRQVEIEEPDPEALAAVPKVTKTVVVEDVEWRCHPILAATEEKAEVPA